MSTNWSYTDQSLQYVQRTLDNGCIESTLASNLEVGTEIGPPPQPSFADYVAKFTPGLQAWMESVAATNAYDSVISCVSYLGSGVSQYAGDAQAMLDWRDALWKWANNWALGFNGQLPNPVPTLTEVMAMAPQPATYGWKVHDKLQPIEVIVVPGDGTSNA